VKKSIEKGLEQLVILGAGYDTRAYRIEGLEKVKVFEVDHPNTQDFKIRKRNI
jgi:methyltransferase (TIGR00027 family)